MKLQNNTDTVKYLPNIQPLQQMWNVPPNQELKGLSVSKS